MNCGPFYLTALAPLHQRGKCGRGRMVVPSGRPLPEVWSPAKNRACLNPQQDKGRQTWFKVKNFNAGIRDVGLDPDFAICHFMTLPKLLNFIFLSVRSG